MCTLKTSTKPVSQGITVVSRGIQTEPVVLCSTFTQTHQSVQRNGTNSEEKSIGTDVPIVEEKVEPEYCTIDEDDIYGSETLNFEEESQNESSDDEYLPYNFEVGNGMEAVEMENVPPHKENKYVVFQSMLLNLFFICNIPSCFCSIVSKTIYTVGTMVIVRVCCKAGHKWEWNSQPCHRGMPWGNLLSACATLVSGQGYTKVSTFFNHFKSPFISQSTFTKLQRSYLIPSIVQIWNTSRASLLASLQKENLVIGGDGRCDSPGFSAKYGTYTLMDLDINKVLDIKLVQVK